MIGVITFPMRILMDVPDGWRTVEQRAKMEEVRSACVFVSGRANLDSDTPDRVVRHSPPACLPAPAGRYLQRAKGDTQIS